VSSYFGGWTRRRKRGREGGGFFCLLACYLLGGSLRYRREGERKGGKEGEVSAETEDRQFGRVRAIVNTCRRNVCCSCILFEKEGGREGRKEGGKQGGKQAS